MENAELRNARVDAVHAMAPLARFFPPPACYGSGLRFARCSGLTRVALAVAASPRIPQEIRKNLGNALSA